MLALYFGEEEWALVKWFLFFIVWLGVAFALIFWEKKSKAKEEERQALLKKNHQATVDGNKKWCTQFFQSSGFSTTKAIYTYMNRSCLAIDAVQKKFAIVAGDLRKILNYGQLVSYELCKDGNTLISGDGGNAAVGGLLFGAVGAVAASAATPREVNKYCSEMYISIVDNSAHRYKLKLIESSVSEASLTYKTNLETARDMMSLLAVIERENSREKNTTHQSVSSADKEQPESVSSADKEHPESVNSVDKEQPESDKSKSNTPVVSEADEIMKFKNLLDKGVITQDEFDAKKKQLLGL